MDVMQKLTQLFLSPEKFFEKVEKEDYWPAMQLYMGLYCILVAIGAVAVLFILGNTGAPFEPLTFAIGLFYVLALILFGAVALWVGSAYYHIGPLLLGGEGYLETFKVYTYSQIIKLTYSVPILVVYGLILGAQGNPLVGFIGLGLIILVALASAIHTIYASTMGFKVLHNQTTGIAFVCAFVIPIAIGFLCYMIFFFLIVFVLGALGVGAVA